MSNENIIPQISPAPLQPPLAQPVVETFRVAALAKIEAFRVWEADQLRLIDDEAGEAKSAYEQRVGALQQRQRQVREHVAEAVSQYEEGLSRIGSPTGPVQGEESGGFRVAPYAQPQPQQQGPVQP